MAVSARGWLKQDDLQMWHSFLKTPKISGAVQHRFKLKPRTKLKNIFLAWEEKVDGPNIQLGGRVYVLYRPDLKPPVDRGSEEKLSEGQQMLDGVNHFSLASVANGMTAKQAGM